MFVNYQIVESIRQNLGSMWYSGI